MFGQIQDEVSVEEQGNMGQKKNLVYSTIEPMLPEAKPYNIPVGSNGLITY